MAVVAINVGEVQLQAVIWVPALPFRAAGAAMKWATDKIGPMAWVLLGVVTAGGIYWYFKQPPERRDTIKKVASSMGTRIVEEYGEAAGEVYRGRLKLHACMVPKPEQRIPVSEILRQLALSPESLSAGQLAEVLNPSCGRPWPTSVPS